MTDLKKWLIVLCDFNKAFDTTLHKSINSDITQLRVLLNKAWVGRRTRRVLHLSAVRSRPDRGGAGTRLVAVGGGSGWGGSSAALGLSETIWCRWGGAGTWGGSGTGAAGAGWWAWGSGGQGGGRASEVRLLCDVPWGQGAGRALEARLQLQQGEVWAGLQAALPQDPHVLDQLGSACVWNGGFCASEPDQIVSVGTSFNDGAIPGPFPCAAVLDSDWCPDWQRGQIMGSFVVRIFETLFLEGDSLIDLTGCLLPLWGKSPFNYGESVSWRVAKHYLGRGQPRAAGGVMPLKETVGPLVTV